MTTIDSCGFELLDHTHRRIPTIRLSAGARREEAPCWSALYHPPSSRDILKHARRDLFPGATDIGIRFVYVCVCFFISLFSLCAFLRCFSTIYNFVRLTPVFCQMFFDPCVLSDVLWPCVLSDFHWPLWSPWYNCTGWQCIKHKLLTDRPLCFVICSLTPAFCQMFIDPCVLSDVRWPPCFVGVIICWPAADCCRVLLFVDEADAFLRKRSKVSY